jgi:hypothetical protein
MKPVETPASMSATPGDVGLGDFGLFGAGQLEATQMKPAETLASMSTTLGDFGLGDSGFSGAGQAEASLCVSEGSVLSAGASQPLLGGNFMEEASQPGVEEYVGSLAFW